MAMYICMREVLSRPHPKKPLHELAKSSSVRDKLPSLTCYAVVAADSPAAEISIEMHQMGGNLGQRYQTMDCVVQVVGPNGLSHEVGHKGFMKAASGTATRAASSCASIPIGGAMCREPA